MSFCEFYLCIAIVSAHTWPMFQNDMQHTGRARVNGPSNASLLWEFDLGATTTSSPVIAEDGTIYIGTSGGYLISINPQGGENWRFNAQIPINASPVILSSGDVCVGTSAGELIAVSSAGSEKWRFSTSGQIASSSSPIAEGTNVYVASDSNLYCVNTSTGKQTWVFRTQGSMDASPAKAGNSIYIQTWWPGPQLYLYSVSSEGSGQWSYANGGGTSSPSLEGETVYFGSNDSYIYGVSTSGSPVFKKLLGGKITASPAISAQGRILVGASNSTFYCLSPAGDVEWTFPTSGAIKSSAAVDASGNSYFGCGDSTFYAVSASGEEIWRFTAGHQIISSPAFGADGTVYFASWDRKLYAIGPGAGLEERSPDPASLLEFKAFPGDHAVTLEFTAPLASPARLRVLDVAGRTISEHKLPSGITRFHIPCDASGSVVFVLLEHMGKYHSRKVVLP